jgi:hypothetical protein
MSDVTAGARVQLTVDVSIAQVYGAGWTFDQIQKDAARGAIAQLHRLLDGKASIVGDPIVTVVWAKDQR